MYDAFWNEFNKTKHVFTNLLMKCTRKNILTRTMVLGHKLFPPCRQCGVRAQQLYNYFALLAT